MTVRELAKSRGFKVVGALRRAPDVKYGLGNAHYPRFVDEAGNEYLLGRDGVTGGCIVTHDGRLL